MLRLFYEMLFAGFFVITALLSIISLLAMVVLVSGILESELLLELFIYLLFNYLTFTDAPVLSIYTFWYNNNLEIWRSFACIIIIR